MPRRPWPIPSAKVIITPPELLCNFFSSRFIARLPWARRERANPALHPLLQLRAEIGRRRRSSTARSAVGRPYARARQRQHRRHAGTGARGGVRTAPPVVIGRTGELSPRRLAQGGLRLSAANGFSHVIVLHGDDQGRLDDVAPALARGDHLMDDACLGACFMPGRRSAALRRASRRNAAFNLSSQDLRRRRAGPGLGAECVQPRRLRLSAVVRTSNDLRFNVYLLLGLIYSERSLSFFPISCARRTRSQRAPVSESTRTLAIAWEDLAPTTSSRTADHRDHPVQSDASTLSRRRGVMAELALLMPMAGQGSRFRRAAWLSEAVDRARRPSVFRRAVETVRRAARLREPVFVALAEHVAASASTPPSLLPSRGRDRRARQAQDGAAENSRARVNALAIDGPIAINDCDHASAASNLPALRDAPSAARGALDGSASATPLDSYAQLAAITRPGGGHDQKQRVGPFAIAVSYSSATRRSSSAPMPATVRPARRELFVSGL